MSEPELSDHEATKRAAQYMLRNGFATYAEIATITGRSRQVVRLWAGQLGAESARERYLSKTWRKALRLDASCRRQGLHYAILSTD